MWSQVGKLPPMSGYVHGGGDGRLLKATLSGWEDIKAGFVPPPLHLVPLWGGGQRSSRAGGSILRERIGICCFGDDFVISSSVGPPSPKLHVISRSVKGGGGRSRNQYSNAPITKGSMLWQLTGLSNPPSPPQTKHTFWCSCRPSHLEVIFLLLRLTGDESRQQTVEPIPTRNKRLRSVRHRRAQLWPFLSYQPLNQTGWEWKRIEITTWRPFPCWVFSHKKAWNFQCGALWTVLSLEKPWYQM